MFVCVLLSLKKEFVLLEALIWLIISSVARVSPFNFVCYVDVRVLEILT